MSMYTKLKGTWAIIKFGDVGDCEEINRQTRIGYFWSSIWAKFFVRNFRNCIVLKIIKPGICTFCSLGEG